MSVSTATQFGTDCALMLHMDGTDESTTFTDSSSNTKTVTGHGTSMEISTAQSKFGGASAEFVPADSDYLSIPHSTDFDFGTGDFTIDFQVRFNNTGGGDHAMFSRGSGAAGSFQYILLNGGNTLYVVLNTTHTFSWTPNANQWYHVAVTRASGTLRAFIDGTSLGSASNSDNVNSNDAVNLGASNVPNAFFDGWLDEFRIVTGNAVWTSNFTPPSAAYTPIVVLSKAQFFATF